METASRLALMAVFAQAGSPRQGQEKAIWNGSREHLPIIRVEDYDAEAGVGGEGKRRMARKRAGGRGSGDGGVRGGGGLEGALWLLLLGSECCVVAGIEGWIVYMGTRGCDFDIWIWLSEFASPALMVLFSASFSAALLRTAGCLGRLGDLGFQAAGLVLATFCAVVICSGASGVGEGERKGVRVVIGLAVKMWFLFFIGFWCAVFQWLRHDREKTTQRKGKRRETGYGTTSGGLATQDETFEGFVGDL